MRRSNKEETHFQLNTALVELVTLAKSQGCAVEMAAILAVMRTGGPRALLYRNPDWDIATRRTVYHLHHALVGACTDDIELALKLAVVWAVPLRAGYPLAPAWALSRVWNDHCFIPALPLQMRKALGTGAGPFIREIAGAFTFEQVLAVVRRYGCEPLANGWLAQAQQHLQHAQRVAWAIAWSIHWERFVRAVEPEQERLLRCGGASTIGKDGRALPRLGALARVRALLASLGSRLSDLWEIEEDGLSTGHVLRTEPVRGRSMLGTQEETSLFLDQCVPLGSRHVCSALYTPPGAPPLVELKRPVSGMPERYEGFRVAEACIDPAIPHVHEIAPAPPNSVGETTASVVETLVRSRPGRVFAQLSQEQRGRLVNSPFLAEVVNYSFDTPISPLVVVRPVPQHDPFEIFSALYHPGDHISVTVLAYDERPGDPDVSLLVQEAVSHLEIVLEPEQLSFTALGCAVREIPCGTTLSAIVDSIDVSRRAVSLTRLPIMKEWLDALCSGATDGEGGFELPAYVNHVSDASLQVLLQANRSDAGLVLAAHILLTSLDKQVPLSHGMDCQLRLSFPDTTSVALEQLPTEACLGLNMRGESLFWNQQRLHFRGCMSSAERAAYLALSLDLAYRRAVQALFLLSNRFIVTGWKLIPRPGRQDTREAAPAPASSEIGHHYHPGDRVTGMVTRLTAYGAFVELEPGVSGMVHKSNMVDGFVHDVGEVVSPGETVELLILAVHNGRIELSMNIPENDPLACYQVGDIVVGKVTGVEEYGAFVQVRPGVKGMVHKSNLAWSYVEHTEDIVTVGDTVSVRVLAINTEKRHLQLSVKHVEEDPLQRYQAGQVVLGTVLEVGVQGALIEVEPGIKGSLDKNDMYRNVRDARKVLSVGEQVEALILRVDHQRRILHLNTQELHQ